MTDKHLAGFWTCFSGRVFPGTARYLVEEGWAALERRSKRDLSAKAHEPFAYVNLHMVFGSAALAFEYPFTLPGLVSRKDTKAFLV
jgi:hypothetical protein